MVENNKHGEIFASFMLRVKNLLKLELEQLLFCIINWKI